jgi:hypothetical protein
VTARGLARAGLVVALTLVMGLPALAQPPKGRQGDRMRAGEVERMFDDLVVRQARQRLGLAPAQVEPFTERLRALQMVRRRAIGERGRLLAEIAKLTNPRVAVVDEAVVAARLEELTEFEARHAANLRQAYGALDEVLTVPQRGRFRVLEDQLERRKLELITRARQGGRPPGKR